MRILQLSGGLPASIAENSGPADWVATLSLLGDTAGLLGIGLLGPDALYFSAGWNPAFGLISLQPASPLDYESLLASGHGASLSVQWEYRFGDGSRQAEPARWQIAVQDRDDTPPQWLGFATGGSVAVGALGAGIGRLRGFDPDTAGALTFQVPEAEAWRLRLQGDTLLLQPGYAFGLDDLGLRSVTLEVSDGTQSAALSLDILVRPDLQDRPSGAVLAAGGLAQGFALAGPSLVQTARLSWEVADMTEYADGSRLVSLRDGGAAMLPALKRLQFADGWYDADAAGPAAEVTALYQAVLGHAPSAAVLAQQVAALQAGGTTPQDIAAALLAGAEYRQAHGTPDALGFLLTLDANVLGHAPDGGLLSAQLWSLDQGQARAQLVLTLALSDAALARQAQEHPDGYWVPAAQTPAGVPVGLHSIGSLGRGELFL